MRRALILTLIGQDRPGLVETLASTVARHAGNWLDSRMARLGGQFAGILRVELPAEHEQPLLAALRALGAEGLEVVCRSEPGPAAPSTPPGPLARLEILGHDRPGIVRDISAALAARGANVEELTSELTSAPMAGGTLFKAAARLRLPPGGDPDAIRRDLERIAADLMVEVRLDPVA